MQVCAKDFSFHFDTSNEGWPQESIRKGRAEIHPLLLGPLDAKRNEGSGLSTGMEPLWREQAISEHLSFAGQAITLPVRPGLRSSSLLGDLPLASIGRMAPLFPV